jgi:HTH-type transcriptional regulator / antitoxin HigA
MEIKPIRNETDYEAALQEIERLFDAEPGTPDADKLEVLVTLVEAYEASHYRIPLPDPVEAIEFEMERLGLSRRDLEPYIGSRARVSEVLNRRRPLSLRMIRQLAAGLQIPPAILIREPQRHGVNQAPRHASAAARQAKRRADPPSRRS